MPGRAKQIAVSATPLNYVPLDDNVEEHLIGIDETLSTIGVKQAYDISGFFVGAPNDDQILVQQILPRDVTVNPQDPGFAVSGIAPTAEVIYDILIDDGSTGVGTVTFEAGSNNGVVEWVGEETILAGEVLKIVAPSVADATHADLTFEILGTIVNAQEAYDFGGSFAGVPASEEVVFSFITPRDIELDEVIPVRAAAEVATTADSTFDVVADAGGSEGLVTIGTLTWVAGARIAFFTFVTNNFITNNVINRNTLIQIIAPTTIDVTLSEFTFSFQCIQINSFTSYDFNFFLGNTLVASQVIYNTVVNNSVIINQTNIGSAYALTPAGVDTTLNIVVGAEVRGSVYFPAGSNEGFVEWDNSRDVVIPADYNLQVVAPDPVDSSIADITFALGGEELTAAEARVFTELCLKSAYWATVDPDAYTPTPVSSTTINISVTVGIKVGQPVRYVQDNAFYYGIVTTVTTDTSISIAGAALSTMTEVTLLQIGDASRIVEKRYLISGQYANPGPGSLLAASAQFDRWTYSTAYLVTYSIQHGVDDSTSNPLINMVIDSNLISTDNSGNGTQVSSGGWSDNSAVQIDTDFYQVLYQDDLEVELTNAGGTGDAEDLSVIATYVLE